MARALIRPLEGFTIVDLGGTVATAACGKLFADFGARVIDVEPPGGSALRCSPPFAPDGPDASGALHALLSPNKESAIAASPGQALRWIAGADVVLDFGPPSIGFERIREAAPGALHVVLSWYGLTGPLANAPGSDAAIGAQIGLVKGIGDPEAAPFLPSGSPISILGGVTAFIAAAAELLGRALGRERRAAQLDVSLLEAAMCLTEVSPIAFFNGGALLPRLGRNRFLPNYPAGIFAASDGWIGVTALTPKQWGDLCELVGLPELGREPRLQVGMQRLAEADALDALLAPRFKQRSAAEWLARGQAKRIPLAPVPTVAELLTSAQLEARGAFRELTLASGRSLRVPGPPFRLTRDAPIRAATVAALGASGDPPPASVNPGAAGAASPATHLRAPLREPARRPSVLRGLRVLDLTMGWAGPLAARHVADLGAEVIKIESRQRFDWWRGWEVSDAFLRDRVYEKSSAHNMVNRNKRGITLDLTTPRGAALFLRLAAEADAVIENYSAGVMAKLGFGAAELHALNPRLVIVSMPPFGHGGPYGDFRAYGSTVEHASGLPHLNGRAGEPPTMLHIALGDPVAGVHGAAALVLALLHQQRTGVGQLVDLSQAEALAGLGMHGLAHQAVLGTPPPRVGNRHGFHAPRGVYPCRGEDQWLTFAVESDAQWRALCTLVDAAALRDPALDSTAARLRDSDRIDAAIAAWTGTRERDELASALLSCGIPAAGVLDVHEVLAHPQLEARGFWQWLERPVVGMQPNPSAPHRSGAAPHAIDTPAPTLGQDTREVLRGLLGLTDAELDELEQSRIIGSEPCPS